jgi:magnesium transporter
VCGLAQEKIIEEIGKQFDLHPLILEDILNTNQRPKYEVYEKYIFVIIDRVFWNEKNEIFENEQISFILGSNFVISFKEQENDLFNPIFDRITTLRGRIRFMKSDYLLYSLIDIIVDNYFIVLELMSEKIENLEDQLIENPEPEVLQSIYKLKRFSIDLRKTVWPIRSIANNLQREQSKLIGSELQIYLRDLYDHIFRIGDLLENYRDIIFGMLDMYLSSLSNRMNEIMKILTIISTTFIPLSFIAGFYGMNFLYMPELRSVVAYPIVILIMIVIAFIMLMFYRRKKWI